MKSFGNQSRDVLGGERRPVSWHSSPGLLEAGCGHSRSDFLLHSLPACVHFWHRGARQGKRRHGHQAHPQRDSAAAEGTAKRLELSRARTLNRHPKSHPAHDHVGGDAASWFSFLIVTAGVLTDQSPAPIKEKVKWQPPNTGAQEQSSCGKTRSQEIDAVLRLGPPDTDPDPLGPQPPSMKPSEAPPTRPAGKGEARGSWGRFCFLKSERHSKGITRAHGADEARRASLRKVKCP